MVKNEPTNTDEKKLGDYLLVSDGTIRNLIKKMPDDLSTDSANKERLGEKLVREGIISQQELDNSIIKQRVHRLSKSPIFATLSTMELVTLSKCFTEVSYPANKIFIMQGEEDPSLFIIASGSVEVFRLNNAGEHIPIATVGVGEPIGEMGYFSGSMRSSYVQTLETTHLLHAQYADLTNYFENVPRVALAFTKIIEQRKKELDQMTSQE